MIQWEWLLIALNIGAAIGWLAHGRFETEEQFRQWLDR